MYIGCGGAIFGGSWKSWGAKQPLTSIESALKFHDLKIFVQESNKLGDWHPPLAHKIPFPMEHENFVYGWFLTWNVAINTSLRDLKFSKFIHQGNFSKIDGSMKSLGTLLSRIVSFFISLGC